MSAKREENMTPKKTTHFWCSNLAKKAARLKLSAEGRWVIEAVAMEDDSPDRNERAIWKANIRASAQAKAAHENFHLVWDE